MISKRETFQTKEILAFKESKREQGKKEYCIIRVSPSGWSEGECKGKAGWFPTAYVVNRQRIPARNAAAEDY
ncbi:SH3 domain-containing protein 3 [Bienertia sinuspersici]